MALTPPELISAKNYTTIANNAVTKLYPSWKESSIMRAGGDVFSKASRQSKELPKPKPLKPPSRLNLQEFMFLNKETR